MQETANFMIVVDVWIGLQSRRFCELSGALEACFGPGPRPYVVACSPSSPTLTNLQSGWLTNVREIVPKSLAPPKPLSIRMSYDVVIVVFICSFLPSF